MKRVLAVCAVVLWTGGLLLLVVGVHQLAPLDVRLFGFPSLEDSLGKVHYGTAAVAAAGLLAVGAWRR